MAEKSDWHKQQRELAQRYASNTVEFLATVAFNEDFAPITERVRAAALLAEIAGLIPSPLDDEDDY